MSEFDRCKNPKCQKIIGVPEFRWCYSSKVRNQQRKATLQCICPHCGRKLKVASKSDRSKYSTEIPPDPGPINYTALPGMEDAFAKEDVG